MINLADHLYMFFIIKGSMRTTSFPEEVPDAYKAQLEALTWQGLLTEEEQEELLDPYFRLT